MNLRTMALGAVALVALGTGTVSLAQGVPGTPPPPPVPGPSSSPLISTSPEPSPLPSNARPSSPGMTPTPVASPSELPSASPSPEGRGRRGRRGPAEGASPGPNASPTETPEPPQFSTLDGVWEIALQPLSGARAIYSHLYVTQSGNTLTGTWRRGKTDLPFTGTFDGRLFKLTVTGGATTELLSGYEENYMDMVGLYSDGDPKHQGTPFTGAHRKREKDREVRIQ